MIKVGYARAEDPDKRYTYKDCIYTQDGWSDAKIFMPADYDLCTLRLKDTDLKKGWASGLAWDGLRIKKDDQIVEWRRD